MAETVAGGVYLNPDGKTYHDAEGKEVKPEVVAEAQKIQREQSQQKLANFTPMPSQSNAALAEAVRSLIVPQAPATPPSKPSEPKP